MIKMGFVDIVKLIEIVLLIHTAIHKDPLTYASDLDKLNWNEASNRCKVNLSGSLIPAGYVFDNPKLQRQLFDDQNYTAWIDGQILQLGCIKDRCYHVVKNKTKNTVKLPFICGSEINENRRITLGNATLECPAKNSSVDALLHSIGRRNLPLSTDYWLLSVDLSSLRKSCASIYSQTATKYYRSCEDKIWAICIHSSFLTSYQESNILTSSINEQTTTISVMSSFGAKTNNKMTTESFKGTMTTTVTSGSGLYHSTNVQSTTNQEVHSTVTEDDIRIISTENMSTSMVFVHLISNTEQNNSQKHQNGMFVAAGSIGILIVFVSVCVFLLWKRSSRIMKSTSEQWKYISGKHRYARFQNNVCFDAKRSGRCDIILSNDENPYSEIRDLRESFRPDYKYDEDQTVLTNLMSDGYWIMKDVKR